MALIFIQLILLIGMYLTYNLPSTFLLIILHPFERMFLHLLQTREATKLSCGYHF